MTHTATSAGNGWVKYVLTNEIFGVHQSLLRKTGIAVKTRKRENV